MVGGGGRISSMPVLGEIVAVKEGELEQSVTDFVECRQHPLHLAALVVVLVVILAASQVLGPLLGLVVGVEAVLPWVQAVLLLNGLQNAVVDSREKHRGVAFGTADEVAGSEVVEASGAGLGLLDGAGPYL
jgi:hypothetical protein